MTRRAHRAFMGASARPGQIARICKARVSTEQYTRSRGYGLYSASKIDGTPVQEIGSLPKPAMYNQKMSMFVSHMERRQYHSLGSGYKSCMCSWKHGRKA